MKHCVLCVDDEVDNVDALERLFRRRYRVIKTTSAIEALEILKKNDVTVIISDQRMPQLTGVELLAESIKTHPNAIRILLTGYTDIDSVIGAINAGQIYRYVTKPWDPVDLLNAVEKAVERFEIGEELVEKNQALEKALQELRTLDQAKSQFMILVNHELKTPLTSMLSFTELLSETKLDAEQSRMLTRIRSAADRLQEMINDALEYVSAETAQLTLDRKSISAARLFSQDSLSVSLVKLAKERGVNFKFSVESRVLMCDEKIMRNVFGRLMHNAIKFSLVDGGKSSGVTVNGLTRADGRYELTIGNRSEPIDERKIENLLKPFTLNENALNHSVGTGLGLSICQALLKLHNSKLQFVSLAKDVKISFDLA